MSVITAIALFVSWLISVWLGIMTGVGYFEWVRKQEARALLEALIREESGHVK